MKRIVLALVFTGGFLLVSDLFEAGYTHRGGADLNDHLRVWDLLTANGLALTGTGVSGTHSAPWEEFGKPEAFVTWIWASDDSDAALLDGLRKRRASFGSPFRFKGGRFDMALRSDPSGAEARMGETLSPASAKGMLTIQMEPKHPEDHVFLVQVKSRTWMELNYVTYHRRVNPYEPIPIDLSESGFLRIEVYNGGRVPVVFSNPIYIKKS